MIQKAFVVVLILIYNMLVIPGVTSYQVAAGSGTCKCVRSCAARQRTPGPAWRARRPGNIAGRSAVPTETLRLKTIIMYVSLCSRDATHRPNLDQYVLMLRNRIPVSDKTSVFS